jgi:CRISPR/Cas system CMR subunit Cmr6 (Cas7 group RAMP superfamily)
MKHRHKTGQELKFSLLNDEELAKIKQQSIDEITFRYKQKKSAIQEKFTKLVEERRQRVHHYISKTKQFFKNYLIALRKRTKLEISFVDHKLKEINYFSIMFVIKIWVFSVIGEIRK